MSARARRLEVGQEAGGGGAEAAGEGLVHGLAHAAEDDGKQQQEAHGLVHAPREQLPYRVDRVLLRRDAGLTRWTRERVHRMVGQLYYAPSPDGDRVPPLMRMKGETEMATNWMLQ